MLKRYWIIIVAFGITTTIPSLGYSQEPLGPALESEPISGDGDGERTADPDENSDAPIGEAEQIAPSLESIERAIRELIPQEDQAERKRDQDREIRDLQVQEQMAVWAERMFWAALASVAVTLVGLALIARTLKYTKVAAEHTAAMLDEATKTTLAAHDTVREAEKATVAAQESIIVTREIGEAQIREAQNATMAARDSVDVTREIGEAQVKAYISVDAAEFSLTDQTLEVSINIKNSGASPALSVQVRAVLRTFRDATENDVFMGKIPVGEHPTHTFIGTIAATASGTAKLIWLAEMTTPDAFLGMAQGHWIAPLCDIQWEDVFGDTHIIQVNVTTAMSDTRPPDLQQPIRSGPLTPFHLHQHSYARDDDQQHA